MSKTFLVTGATGYQGGSLARVLRSQNHTVNALIRDPSSPKALALKELGVKIFHGSFDDVAVIKNAISGCAGLFLNPFPTPADPQLQVQHARNFINAAIEEQCPLVLSTAFMTAQKESWVGSSPQDFLYLYYSINHIIEEEVRSAASIGKLKAYTILRPAYLMHNYLIPFSFFHYPELPKQGVMKHMYIDGRRISHLDSADVGKLAAVVLQTPEKYDKLEIDLGGENLDADEAAAIIRKVSGREDIVTEKLVIPNFDTVKKTGLTWHYYANTQDTELANKKEVEELFGVKLTSFEEYLVRERELLNKSLPAQKE
ncbi:uncharacterized protein BHQ10_003268 [Talaromyces amestolkiae]|uniref:NmrA-like domain-containing protein n=1 Tax=Talaromyces amestolkiae TaxID=1196081 RepID=A0A364KUM7_TALAM|nr:uncharacterized protein BHQ10_003268 [Talaromyces amestolkiae]RAO67256.1 hypothetical protein BHQ10_003268 [Talaromyces amestolkiae]